MGTKGGTVYLRSIVTLVLLVFFSALPISGLSAENVSAQPAQPAQPAYQVPVPEDFSGLTWSKAFDKLHGKLSREYAFTDWKKIDWPALYKMFRPRIDQAQSSKDFSDYYLSLREYVHSIPDGHVRMTTIRDIDNKYIGGGFGFSATKLSDGMVIASWVDETGAAYAQGLRVGAELIEWNSRPVKDVLNNVATVFASNSATTEDLANQKVRYLTRAPINTKISLLFLNNGELMRATVVAYDDKEKSLTQTYPATVVSDGLRDLILQVDNPHNPPESMIEKKILSGNIGYIKIWGELDVDFKNTGKTPSTLALFRAALIDFNSAKVKGLIIDIRNNVGGLDSMVADMLASFYPAKTLYEYQNSLNASTGFMEIQPDDAQKDNDPEFGLYIKPNTPAFKAPVIALINSKCISSGEGVAMGIKKAPRGETVGFYGTNGSFGMAGGEAKMPGNIEVHWPYGQSLDKNKQVQIDSRDGVGGISPSIRIPMTRENALKVAQGEDVELEHAIEVINAYGAAQQSAE